MAPELELPAVIMIVLSVASRPNNYPRVANKHPSGDGDSDHDQAAVFFEDGDMKWIAT